MSGNEPIKHATGGTWARRGGRWVLTAAVLAGAAGAVWWMHHSEQVAAAERAKPPAAMAMPPASVRVATVEPADLPLQQEFVAQTRAYQNVELRPRVQGYLVKRDFEDGQAVHKGQVLFEIDPRPFEAELEQARSKVDQAEAKLAQASRQAKRFKELVARGAATERELEDWQTDEQVTQAALRLDRADVALAELNLGYTKITAPFDGQIGQRMQDVGSLVDASSLLATEMQTDPIYVTFLVSELDLLGWQRRLADGQQSGALNRKLTVSLKLADGSAYDHDGTVDFVDIKLDPQTGTAELRAVVPNPDHKLRPGQFARVSVLGATRLHALTVPQEAVVQSPAGSFVYVVKSDMTVENREVKLGDWVGKRWIVESGLKPGDRVVYEGLQHVGPGARVTIASDGDPAATASAAALEPKSTTH